VSSVIAPPAPGEYPAGMSKQNGDKARFEKARMKRLRRRESTRALRKASETPPAAPAPTKPR